MPHLQCQNTLVDLVPLVVLVNTNTSTTLVKYIGIYQLEFLILTYEVIAMTNIP